jgi:hypothetical protein
MWKEGKVINASAEQLAALYGVSKQTINSDRRVLATQEQVIHPRTMGDKLRECLDFQLSHIEEGKKAPNAQGIALTRLIRLTGEILTYKKRLHKFRLPRLGGSLKFWDSVDSKGNVTCVQEKSEVLVSGVSDTACELWEQLKECSNNNDLDDAVVVYQRCKLSADLTMRLARELQSPPDGGEGGGGIEYKFESFFDGSPAPTPFDGIERHPSWEVTWKRYCDSKEPNHDD